MVDISRNLNALVKAELDKTALVAVPLLYLDFLDTSTDPDTVVQKYYAGSNTDISFTAPANYPLPSGNYLGVGGISSVSAAEESIELKAPELTVSLNGIGAEYIAQVLGLKYYARDAILGLAVLDSNYSMIANEPIILFKGFMSKLETSIGSESTVTVNIQSILADWERPRVRRYNSASQASLDPNDKGFSQVEELVSKEVIWNS